VYVCVFFQGLNVLQSHHLLIPHVVPNPYDQLSTEEHKRRYLAKCSGCSFTCNYNEWEIKLPRFKMMQKYF